MYDEEANAGEEGNENPIDIGKMKKNMQKNCNTKLMTIAINNCNSSGICNLQHASSKKKKKTDCNVFQLTSLLFI